jgi:hypothetical protein
VPPWIAYSGVAVVGGTALLVLAYYQHLLGQRAGMPWVLSWSFSIGLDWGSAVAGIFWFFGRAALRAWGRAAAVLLVVGSTVLTCLAWGLQAGAVWAPLGVIHPAVVFLMAKLLTLWQAQRAEDTAQAQERADVLADARAAVSVMSAALGAEQDVRRAAVERAERAEATAAQRAEPVPPPRAVAVPRVPDPDVPSRAELRAEAKRLGLPQRGTAAELAARIAAARPALHSVGGS